MAGGLSFLGRSADDTSLSPEMQAWLAQQAQSQDVPAAVPPGYSGYNAPTAPAAADPNKVLTPLGQKWGNDLVSAVTAPRDAYRGDLQVFGPDGHVTDEAMNRANGMAGLAMTGGVGGVGPGGVSLGAGPIRAYHGSPHDFDAFSMSKIGTGEGNQAFGSGLYFAEKEGVAKSYRDALAAPTPGTPEYAAVKALRNAGDDREAAASALAGQSWSRPGRAPQVAPTTQAAIDLLRSEAPVGGRMYEVGLNADPERFLHWDKPLSEQPAAVRDAIASGGRVTRAGAVAENPNMTGGDYYRMLGPPDAASMMLNKVGVPGIKYADAGSRGVGEGTHNYVAFSDDIVSILRKYGLAGLVGGGAAAGAMAQPGDAQAATPEPLPFLGRR